MSKNEGNSTPPRYQRRRESQQKKRTRTYFSAAASLLGVVILIALMYVLPRQILTRDNFETNPDEAVYGEPIHATHEMTGSQVSNIAFYPSSQPQPKIQATHQFYDLGDIGAEEVVVHQIAVKNIGDAPLIISRAYTTCGCTTAHIGASELQPGEATMVTVTLDAGYHDVRGQTVRRGVIIENNDPNNAEFTFWMEASVRTTP